MLSARGKFQVLLLYIEREREEEEEGGGEEKRKEGHQLVIFIHRSSAC